MNRVERWLFRTGILLLTISAVQGQWLTAAIGAGLLGMSIEDHIFGKED